MPDGAPDADDSAEGLGEDDDPDEKRNGGNEYQHPETNADSEPPQD
jgi:hypothetical protein